MTSKLGFILSTIFILSACAHKKSVSPETAAQGTPIASILPDYCRGTFRLGQYPEMVDHVVADALKAKNWDLKKGAIKGDKWGGQNTFVAHSLEKNSTIKEMLGKCKAKTVKVEKVFVSKLAQVDVKAEIKALGKNNAVVPHEGLVHFQ